jgi:hypothetical protein
MFVLLLRELKYYNETFFPFFRFFFFKKICASVLTLRYYIVAQVRFNWYLHDINKFSSSKKKAQLIGADHDDNSIHKCCYSGRHNGVSVYVSPLAFDEYW